MTREQNIETLKSLGFREDAENDQTRYKKTVPLEGCYTFLEVQVFFTPSFGIQCDTWLTDPWVPEERRVWLGPSDGNNLEIKDGEDVKELLRKAEEQIAFFASNLNAAARCACAFPTRLETV